MLAFVVPCVLYVLVSTQHEKHTGIYFGIDEIKTRKLKQPRTALFEYHSLIYALICF